jgi:glycosyltransferase involved in cell wall biosynthesis
MPDDQEAVSLVIPCYNEAARLDMRRFTGSPSAYAFLFVNDGSTDGTADLVRRQADDRIVLLDLPRNVGKGEAVRTGMLHAARTPPLSRAAWIGYWDADLATPLSEVDGFLQYSRLYGTQVDSVWGSRVYRLGGTIRRRYSRHLAGRLFATVAGVSLNLPCYDSQCGAKLFRRQIVDAVFSEPFISRWLFDVELLMRLSRFTVVEYPLRHWREIPGSALRLSAAALSVLPDLARIRRRYGRLRSPCRERPDGEGTRS